MPRKASLVVPKKPRTSRRAKSAAPILEAAAHTESSVCQACRSLPIGSVELVSLLLVLVFSLSAVLITSGYALSQQHERVVEIESQQIK